MIKNIIKVLLGNPVLANILMLLIFVSGAIGAVMMVREIFPRFSLDIITVTVSYPGADPEEIEEGICLKLEEALEGIEDVKEITTTASENVGSAMIECEENADVYRVKDEVKTLVDAITTFPEDAEKPIVQEVKFRGDVCALILSGDLPERQLKEIARKLENELLQIKGISQTSIGGARKYEISIEVSEENLRKYGLTFAQISEAVKRNGMNLPAGSIKTNTEDFRIRMIGRRYKAKNYENIPIIKRKDGTIITLGQIARIHDTFDEESDLSAIFNGEPAVEIGIYKTEEEDSIYITKQIDKFIAQKSRELPANVHLTKFRDRSRMVIDRLRILMKNGRFGLFLVFLALWIFLDIRLSFWVAMGIPISLAGAMAIMASFGGSINMLSMFGMIMVLGIIVDDAIVVGESIYSKRTGGDGPRDAAVNGTAEVALPVIAAVLTTIVAFIPLFFIKGVMGKFIRQIPIPVVAALGVSLVEGLFILPVHLRHLPVPGEMPKIKCFRLASYLRSYITRWLNFFINNIYGPFMDSILTWRYAALSIAIAVLMTVIGIIQGGIIKFVFLPQADDDFIRAKIEFPAGSPIKDTRLAAQKLLAGWKKVEKQFQQKIPEGKKLTVGVYALIGGSIRFDEAKGNSNQMEVAIELLPSEERNIYYLDLLDAWQKEVGNIPGTIATKFETFRKGPGGNPIEIQLMGENHDELLDAANKLAEKLKTMEGTFDVQTDYRPGKREFIVSIKPEAYKNGLTLNDIAQHVQGGFYGNEALRIQRGRDDIKVKVRYPEKSGRNSIEYFEKLRIKTPDGNMIPFLSVADIKMAEGQSTITRKNRKKIISVSCDVNDKQANAQEILEHIQSDFMPQLTKKYDVSYSLKGQSEETSDSLGSLFIGFPLALFGIYFIIASMFRSYIQPLVIMTTIPFGLIGGVIGHMLFGLSLTIMSLFGMVALAGIVVNDAIVLIEGINIRLAAGMPLFEALREGGKRRFRAIMLTTITTFVGLMPLILEKSMQAQFLIPMAISIAFGVLFATLLTLVLIPCLMAILNDIRRTYYLVWHFRLPSRDEVEPRAKAHLLLHHQEHD